MTAILITASTDPTWIRPIAALRARGISTVVVRSTRPPSTGWRAPSASGGGEIAAAPASRKQRAQRARALRHALAEYELKVHLVMPGQALGEALVG